MRIENFQCRVSLSIEPVYFPFKVTLLECSKLSKMCFNTRGIFDIIFNDILLKLKRIKLKNAKSFGSKLF